MNSKVNLKLDWCSHAAAKYAVEHWHYSKRMPKSKLAKIGVWEDGIFIGTVIYGYGAGLNIGRPYGLIQTEVSELVRVALSNKHHHPTSKILSLSLKYLAKQMNGIKLIVSYADSSQGHAGIIYQASNWIYVGDSFDNCIEVFGKKEHRRSLSSRYGTNSIEWIRQNIDPKAKKIANEAKHKYLFPFDSDLRSKILLIAKPYPKKRVASSDSGTTGNQPERGGASPTATLQNTEVTQ